MDEYRNSWDFAKFQAQTFASKVQKLRFAPQFLHSSSSFKSVRTSGWRLGPEAPPPALRSRPIAALRQNCCVQQLIGPSITELLVHLSGGLSAGVGGQPLKKKQIYKLTKKQKKRTTWSLCVLSSPLWEFLNQTTKLSC